MKRSKKQFPFLITLIALTTLACNQPEKPDHQDQIRAGSDGQALKARALLIGLVPEQDIFKQMERYEPLAEYLSKRLGRKIKLKVLVHYGNIIDNFISMGMDGAFLGSFTFALAQKRLGLEVLARPENLQGLSTYHSHIFVRKDSGIRSIKDMQGKVFVFVDKATYAGFLVPIAFFHEHGIDHYKSYFRETYFAGTHSDVILDVLSKKADIGAAKNTVYDQLIQRDPRIKGELTILSESPDVPENALALRADLDDSLKSAIKDHLIHMHNDLEGRMILQNFGARRFVETRDQDYKPVYDFAEKVGLDLATYDYLIE